jgi:hypothetical protein
MIIITSRSIVRCVYGHALSNLKEIDVDGDGKQFLRQRCENCGDLLLVRSDGVVMVTH